MQQPLGYKTFFMLNSAEKSFIISRPGLMYPCECGYAGVIVVSFIVPQRQYSG